MEKNLKGLRIDPEKKRTSGASHGWGLTVLLLVAGGLLAAGVYHFWVRQEPEQTNAAAVAAPDPDKRTNRTIAGPSPVLIVSGYVVAHHRINLGSKVMGKVAWVGVEKGDRVKKGQLLVKLDDQEYAARLREAQAALAGAEARLSELEAGYRFEEIEKARADMERSQAELDNARLESQRLERLLEAGVISRQEFDNARSRKDVAAAALRAAEKNYELLQAGPRPEQIDQARAEVGRARANVDYARTLLEGTELRSPITGTVLERIAEVGEMVTTSFAGDMGAKSAVVALADLEDLRVELDISQSDFGRVSRELECRMSPEAYSDREYPCEIAEISPEANRQKATIQVKVRVLEPDEYLRPEMTARVTFFEENGTN